MTDSLSHILVGSCGSFSHILAWEIITVTVCLRGTKGDTSEE